MCVVLCLCVLCVYVCRICLCVNVCCVYVCCVYMCTVCMCFGKSIVHWQQEILIVVYVKNQMLYFNF